MKTSKMSSRNGLQLGLLAHGIVLLAVIAPSEPVQGQVAQQEAEGIVAVVVELASGTFLRALPFDTPFLLTGDPPERAYRIEGEWCGIKDWRDFPYGCVEGQPKRQLGGWRVEPDSPAPKVHMYVPQRLDADRPRPPAWFGGSGP